MKTEEGEGLLYEMTYPVKIIVWGFIQQQGWAWHSELPWREFWWKGKGLEMVSHQQKHRTGLFVPEIGQNEENTWMNYKDKIWHEIWQIQTLCWNNDLENKIQLKW